ncbi:hypothetical protein LJC68_06835, partial [Bacteroidales bacterium OttesenSCG-928-B11]|nr:hypothetical protein [Bacteroidales bacterium OttesenSCG-928-B11]
MSENTTNNNYTPLSYLMKMEDLPEFLQFIKGGMEQMFGNLYYKDHRTFKSTSGSIAYHKLNIVSQNRLDWEIPGTGMSLVLNPSHTNNTISEFPITLFWEWKILQYFRGFNLKQFAGSPKELFELAIGVLGISKIDFAKQVMRVFVEPSGGKSYLQQFADDLNLNYNFSNEEDPFSKLEEIIDGIDIYAQAFMYYVSQGSITEIKEKIGELFASLLPDDIIKYILNLVKPKAQAMLQLSAGLEFPENILKPMDNNGNVLEGQKVMLTLDGISLLVDTETGFEIENDIACSLSNAQIGNTGFEISFEKLKLDLSKNRNIAEADAEGRPKEFMGAYIESAAINLPRKWFDNSGNQPLSLIGERLLIGTGGFSGTVGMVGTTTKWVRLGGDKGFEIGFNSFDITFKQNSVVDSNIRGILRIPNFTPPNSSSSGLEIEVIGHISGDGDFNLTASVESGISATLFEKVMFTFYSLELGREDSVFYIGTSCDISFKTDSVVTQIMGSDTIPIPKLRIYSNGSIEIVGGTIPVPSSLSLNLGPAKVGVTGINFGSYEGLDSSGTRQRKYNYFGFDGAISVDPLGLDVRGEGLKYYYAVDNAGNDADSFFRIQTISMDLVLPGNVSPEKAMVIIKGMLSIPSPGESKEYAGEISLKLPKIGIAASAQMRLAPKYPAFIVDASVDLPAPIPIGPIGIYGFRALLGYNYVAEKEAVGLVSGKDTWYDYYVHAPKGINIKKFSGPDRASSYKAPISLGAGVVVGTSFDNAKIISVRAMMVLSLPSVFMIDGRATILKDRLGLDPNDTPPFFAMLAWGDNSVELGMGADLKINKDNTVFLTVDARVEAMFPLKNASGWYVNAGTEEKPIQASLFPDLMTLRVQAYLMLSAQGFKTAARADFELDKKFFGVHVYIYAFAEVGAHISFERPQFGGHLHLGGGIDVNVWKIFYLGFDLNVYLAAEVSKPARIGAKLNFAGRLKLLFINVDFNVDVNLEWEKEKDVDLNAIAPIPTDASTAKTMVKGVHMVTNESFELDYFSSEPAANAITAVIPADSFIDIKSAKPLAKTDLNGKIIDFAMVTTGKELIPPVGTTKNGKKLRQVTHQYQIEEITIKADDGRGTWQTYHPYKAMLHNGTSANDLPYGSWQIRGEQRDTIRLLDSNPFSYLNPGEPNWITPDFLGITPKKIFCPENTKLMRCIDVSNKNAGTKYYYKGEAAHHINGAYFRLENFYQGATHPDDPVTPNILQVINDPYTSRSLNFSNYNSLVIILPEDSVSTSLTLGSCAETVKVKYYSKTLNQVSGEYDYILAREDVLRHLQAPYIASYNETTPICMIVVEPQAPNIDLINSLRDEIENLKNDPMFREYPDGRMEQLQIELYAVLQDNCCQCDPNNYSYGSRCGT